MGAAFEVDAGTGTVNIRNAAGEEHHGSRARVAVSRHERPFELQERAVELSLPGRLQKWHPADQICGVGIDPDFEFVDLGADNDLGFGALEFRAKRKGVAIRGDRSRRCGIAQYRPAYQSDRVEVGHDELVGAREERDQGGAGRFHDRTDMNVNFFTCHSRYMKFSKSYLSSTNLQRK